MHNPRCFSTYMGLWACKPSWLAEAYAAVRAGTIRVLAEESDGDHGDPPPYRVVDGVAVIPMSGHLMKGYSKFGGTSTVGVRRAVRAALADGEVTAVLLHIDSPGGTVAGTKELADEIRAADGKKPVHAYIEDLGASAAYWAASQASRVSANALAEVGSIGVYGVLVDSSKAAELEGIKVHVVASGPMKAAGYPGTEVTPEILADHQGFVDAVSTHFFEAVRKGRGLAPKKLAAVTDGRTWLADFAVGLGLLDGVDTLDQALAEAAKAGKQRARANATAARVRKI